MQVTRRWYPAVVAARRSVAHLRICNKYVKFSHMTTFRHELVIEGTASANPGDETAAWREYGFRYKPSGTTVIRTRSCFCFCVLSPCAFNGVNNTPPSFRQK